MISSWNISVSGIVKYILFLLVLEFQELWPLITQLVFEMGFQKKEKKKAYRFYKRLKTFCILLTNL